MTNSLANGGIVKKPTLAYLGHYTKDNDHEVIVPLNKLHPCIPIHRYRIMVGINKTIYERRKPLSKGQLKFIRKKLNWEIDEI